MSFIEDFVDEMNKVQTYEIQDGEQTFKTIRCDLVCDILTVLFDKYDLERGINDDLHG